MPTDQTNRPCGFCKKPCTEPKFLPCFHAFCKVCLKFQIIKVPTNRQWEGFSCPSCNVYIKAVDPDQPLTSWADQFPDTPWKRKPMRKRQSSEESFGSEASSTSASPFSRDKTFSIEESEPTSVPLSPVSPGPVSPGPISPGPVSPVSPGPVSPGPISPGPVSPGPVSPGPVSPGPISPGPVSPGPISPGPVSPGPISPGPISPGPISPGPMSPVRSDLMTAVKTESTAGLAPFTPVKTGSDITHPGSPQMSTQTNESDLGSETDSSTDPKNHNEQNMCPIHLWKAIIVSCSKCDSLACGQCLREYHPSCKGEDFKPLPEVSICPSVTQLEEEIHKISPVSDMMTSSSYQLQQTRELIRQKIKQMALQTIQSMKKEEEQMVKKVHQLYNDEICRLNSGISPSKGLLQQVQEVSHLTEDLSKHLSAALLLQADDILNTQNDLLGKLKTVDFACVPPEIDFVRDYESLTVTLGDLVTDHGFYPKHDIPDTPVEVALETLTVTEAAASSNATPKSNPDQGVPQKNKSKSFMGKLFSPLQKSKSKFYVKPPEL